ncbi:MAG: alpha/beta hydrolase [Candidatus Aminicenantes bacterium]|nr:alpha/beta hydrolase [Candidatus Aminicenantes bacterium]
MSRFFFTIVISTTFIYIVLVAYLFFFQSRFVYFPKREILQTPKSINLEYQEICYQTSDDVLISAWFIPTKKPKATILFCHGNAGNISHRLESIKIFHHLQLSTFIFDYRGYGQSEGRTTEKGTYLDAEAAWNYLVNELKISNNKIIVFGRSLGGSIAAWLAQKHNPRGLIVESSFTSIPELGAKLYPIFPVKLLSHFKYNTSKYLKKINCPVLIIHSLDDEIISYSNGQKLYDSALSPKEFLSIRGSHNEGFILSEQLYIAGLQKFISSLERHSHINSSHRK